MTRMGQPSGGAACSGSGMLIRRAQKHWPFTKLIIPKPCRTQNSIGCDLMSEQPRNDESETGLPIWLQENFAEIIEPLSPKGKKEAIEFRNQFSEIKKLLGQMPYETKLLTIHKIKPEFIKTIYPDSLTGLMHISEQMVGVWAFQATYKIKSHFMGLDFGLERGNFLLSFACARGILEEAAHFSYFLSRIFTAKNRIQQLLRNESKKLKSGKLPQNAWVVEMIKSHFELISCAEKALQGSDFDWNNFINTIIDDYPIDENQQRMQYKSQSESRKTHISKSLENLEKKYKIPATTYYDLFSEMVHPNFGSNTLVIVTREHFGEDMSNLTLSSEPKNNEAASYFISLISGPMSDILKNTKEMIIQSQDILRFFQSESKNSVENWISRVKSKR